MNMDTQMSVGRADRPAGGEIIVKAIEKGRQFAMKMAFALDYMHRTKHWLFGLTLIAVVQACSVEAAESISEYTNGMTSHEGFIPVHLDRRSGAVYLEVDRFDEDILYMVTLATGLGSNDVRVDRGQPGPTVLVRFERHGGTVLLVQQNTDYDALGSDEVQRRAVDESFPRSVLAAMPVVASGDTSVLVEATSLFLSDVWGVRSGIQSAGRGDVRVDGSRSVVSESFTTAFPLNTEVRAILTFTGDRLHSDVSATVPDRRHFTIEQHHSFMQLPEVSLEPRRYDPRTGNSAATIADYAQGFDGDYRQRMVTRWRLEPRDPDAYLRGELVDPIEPIVFHIDPALPEPYRTAYVEGAEWWNVAYEAAGFSNALQVRDLPEGVDPNDARYSMITHMHRRVAGPSHGGGRRDPRTGEILQGMPRMDSHRSLINYNIYAGLLPVYDALGIEPQISAEQFTMDRRRQHVAHEVGHALGLPHNHIAAAQGRISVMDYPFPLIKLDDRGRLDISDAYRLTMGYSDTLAIRYAYTWFPDAESEAEGLAAIVQEALDRDHLFLTGRDAWLSGSYPEVQQWVEGADMFEAVDRTMAVRSLLMEHFDERAIKPGEPMAWLNQRFAHVYLHHRYAVQGLVKYIGGMQYRYTMRGDGQTPTEVIAPELQRAALDRMLEVMSAQELHIPERILRLIPPLPSGYDEREPWLETPAGPALDPLALARSYAQEVVDSMLLPERLARVSSFHSRDPNQLSLDEVMSSLVGATWGNQSGQNGTMAPYQRVTQRAVLDGLFSLVSDDSVTSEVRDAADFHLMSLSEQLHSASAFGDTSSIMHHTRALREIDRYLDWGHVPSLRTGVIDFMWLPWP
jgi:hypothetical protein